MRKAIVGLSAALLLVAGVAACISFFRIYDTLTEARQSVRATGNVSFDLITLRHDPALAFEALPAPNGYLTGAAFAGKLYLAGPGGLAIYDSAAAPPKLLATGVDLPAAPIVALAAGRLRGDNAAHLIAATRGEGLLIFSVNPADPIRQLRPGDAAARDITAILPLASGDLLIGTQHTGLLMYDGKSLRLFQPAFAGVSVTALAGDEGDFWVGTRNRGVLHWHAGQTDVFDQTSGLPDPQVEDIAVAAERVFVGTPMGVAAFRNGQPERVLAPGLFAHRLAIEGDTLLVATIDQGLHQLDLRPRSSPHAPAVDESLNVTSFFSADGNLLSVSDGRLLRRDRGGPWHTVLEAGQPLADRNVTSLSFSPDGRLWIGYFDRGIDVLNLQSGLAEHVEDDHVFCVNRIVVDPQRDTMDVATANGLVLFDPIRAQPTVRQVLLRRDGLISDQVSDIAFTRDGMTLATPAGLTFFTPSGAQSLYAFEGLVNNHVYTLAAERTNGRVLAGTLGGISILDDENVRQNLTLKNSGLKRNWITAIVRVPQADGADAWLVGTYGGGVVEIDAAGSVAEMDGANPAAVINPNAMLVTPQHVFAGSLADGLLIYNRASQRWSAITAGLPSKNVTALAENGGMLYVGTENGIVRIPEARLP